MSTQTIGNTSFTQGTNGLWHKKTHSLLWVTLCQTSWWNRFHFASCSDHHSQGFKWEGGFDVKMVRSGVRVVSPGCGRPITNSFRPEQLLSESLLERIGKTRQTSQRIVTCGQWFLPKICWDPGTLTSVNSADSRVRRGWNFLPRPSQISSYPCDLFTFCYFLLYLDRLIPPPTVYTSIWLQYLPTGPLTCPSPFSFSFVFLPKQFPFFSNQAFFYQPILILMIMETKALKVCLTLTDL